MQRMQRDPSATAKARERERKEEARTGLGGLSFKPVKLASSTAATTNTSAASLSAVGLSGGFKKGGFKSAFAPAVESKGGGGGAGVKVEAEEGVGVGGVKVKMEESEERGMSRGALKDEEWESSTDDEDYYDPRYPTGCAEMRCSAARR